MQEEYTELRAGGRLRASIEGRGWTLAVFSRISGIPYRSIQDYVADKSKPGFDQLAKFADKGLDVQYILTGKSADSEDNSLPFSFKIDDIEIGRHPFRPVEVNKIIDKVPDKFSLREWISIWDLADDSIPPSEEFKLDPEKRQGAVILAATTVVLGLIERMKTLGWIPR